MRIEAKYKGESVEIVLWDFPPEDAEEILSTVRRLFYTSIHEPQE